MSVLRQGRVLPGASSQILPSNVQFLSHLLVESAPRPNKILVYVHRNPTVDSYDYDCVALYIVLENPPDKVPNYSSSLTKPWGAEDFKPTPKPQLPSNPLSNPSTARLYGSSFLQEPFRSLANFQPRPTNLFHKLPPNKPCKAAKDQLEPPSRCTI